MYGTFICHDDTIDLQGYNATDQVYFPQNIYGYDIYFYTATFNIGFTPQGGVLPPRPPDCFLEGTEILTTTGAKTVEQLRIGDRVRTWGRIEANRSVPNGRDASSLVKWIGRVTLPIAPHTVPVCFPKNTFGAGAPYKPLFVSHGHLLLTKSGKGIRAANYVGWEGVSKDFSRTFNTYYHVELEEHSVVLANGVLAESYLDVGNRGNFPEFKR
jgi:antigen 43